MIRRVALGVVALATLALGTPARADAPGGGGCGGRSRSQDCPPADRECSSCNVDDSSCTGPLERQGYTSECQRGAVEYWCKPTSASRAGFDFTMPLAGVLLGVSAWSTTRIGRRRTKGS